jgi:hypothetical protein
MLTIRPFTTEDVPDLEKAIAADVFHPGEWKVSDFTSTQPPVVTNVISDKAGPIAFVRYTKTLRISCVWNDGTDISRNASAIIQGIQDAVSKARTSGFSEIIITTSHPKLASFLVRIMGMTKSSDEYLLAV